jgi:hypothetical protein
MVPSEARQLKLALKFAQISLDKSAYPTLFISTLRDGQFHVWHECRVERAQPQPCDTYL